MKSSKKLCQFCRKKFSRSNISHHHCLDKNLIENPWKKFPENSEKILSHQVKCKCGKIISKVDLKRHQNIKTCPALTLKEKIDSGQMSKNKADIKLFNIILKEKTKVCCIYCNERMFKKYLKNHLDTCIGKKLYTKNRSTYYEQYRRNCKKQTKIFTSELKLKEINEKIENPILNDQDNTDKNKLEFEKMLLNLNLKNKIVKNTQKKFNILYDQRKDKVTKYEKNQNDEVLLFSNLSEDLDIPAYQTRERQHSSNTSVEKFMGVSPLNFLSDSD